MQFSDTTNFNGIIQEIERLTDLGLTAISGDATRLKQFTVDINNEMASSWYDIFSASNGWIYDDANQTDLPQGTENLVSGTYRYALPTDALTIERVECKDSGGTWRELEPYIAEKFDGALADIANHGGSPTSYRLVGGTVELYPAPNYASTAGLKVYFKRGAVAFVSTDTTDTIGFASIFHSIIPMGVSIRWLKIKQPNSPSLPNLELEYARLKEQMKDFYANRFSANNPPQMTTRGYNFD